MTGSPGELVMEWQHQFHFTVPDHWMNDPQRPIYVDGRYLYYYLYNADYPEPTGTAWRRASTSDGVRFVDHGVALDKYTQPNGDLWSGSMVSDDEGTAGLGRGTVIALVTQPDRVNAAGAQAQFLWFSTDGGATFTNLSDAPVLPNPGHVDFRDPKVVRDHERRRWVCVLAEGHELGIYASDDLRSWRQVSRFAEDRYGVLECPDLFSIVASDGATLWVLAASVNETSEQHPGTYGYWVGSFDGTTFAAFNDDPRWLDHGFDWYAAVTWPVHDDDGVERQDKRWALGWMNNWAYANTTPTWDEASRRGYNGIDSIVRELTLERWPDGSYALRSVPRVPPADSADHSDRLQRAVVAEPPGAGYRAQLTVNRPAQGTAGLRVMCSPLGDRYVEIGVSASEVYIDRSQSTEPSEGRLTRAQAQLPAGSLVEIDILVDRATVEVFVDGGRTALSVLAFPARAESGLVVFGPVGAVSVTSLRAIPGTAALP